jgi:hypothetical protein
MLMLLFLVFAMLLPTSSLLVKNATIGGQLEFIASGDYSDTALRAISPTGKLYSLQLNGGMAILNASEEGEWAIFFDGKQYFASVDDRKEAGIQSQENAFAVPVSLSIAAMFAITALFGILLYFDILKPEFIFTKKHADKKARIEFSSLRADLSDAKIFDCENGRQVWSGKAIMRGRTIRVAYAAERQTGNALLIANRNGEKIRIFSS